MRMKVLIVLLIISLGFNLGMILTFVLKNRGPETMECGWHRTNLRERFNLSSDQVQILEKKRTEMQAKTQPIRERLQRYRIELLNLQKTEVIDTTKFDSLLRAIAQSQYEIEKSIFMHMRVVRGILDSNQQLQFDKQLQDNLCPQEGGGCLNKYERR